MQQSLGNKHDLQLNKRRVRFVPWTGFDCGVFYSVFECVVLDRKDGWGVNRGIVFLEWGMDCGQLYAKLPHIRRQMLFIGYRNPFSHHGVFWFAFARIQVSMVLIHSAAVFTKQYVFESLKKAFGRFPKAQSGLQL